LTIKINREKKELAISVRDLTLYSGLRKFRSGIFFRNAEEGQEIHSQIQTIKQSENTNYQQEFYVKHSFIFNGWKITVRGRIDLLLKTPKETKIEEIKTVYTKHYEGSPDDPQTDLFKWQLLFYAWILMHDDPSLPNPVLRLIVVNRYDNRQYDVDFPYRDVTKDIHERILDIITREEERHYKQESKTESLKNLQFPFPYRQHQNEIIQRIHEVLNQELNFIIEAPSGLGKTVVSLYTLLPQIITKNTKLFFLTAKTTQRHIVEKTLQIFRSQNVDFLAVILRAKEKMCTNDFYFCHEDFCPFLHAHMNENPEIYKERVIDQRGVISPEVPRRFRGSCSRDTGILSI
jgi:hypothetical protein